MKLNLNLCIFIVLFLFTHTPLHTHATTDNTIRIMVEQLPAKILGTGPTDYMGRKIAPLLQSGHYRATQFTPKQGLVLTPATPKAFTTQKPTLQFIVIQNMLTRMLTFKRGQADVLYDTLSLSTTEWLRQNNPDTPLYSAAGLNFSILGFNLRHPDLLQRRVREAIASQLPIADIAHHKWRGWVDPFTEFKIAEPEYQNATEACNALKKINPKKTWVYLTTGVREGLDLAIILREALLKCGINMTIKRLEPTLFYSKLKSGDFALFSTRVLRMNDNDPMAAWIQSTGKQNFTGYSNVSLNHAPPDQTAWRSIRKTIEHDLPFIPLYSWRHGLILSSRIAVPKTDPPLSETFSFLENLRLQSVHAKGAL